MCDAGPDLEAHAQATIADSALLYVALHEPKAWRTALQRARGQYVPHKYPLWHAMQRARVRLFITALLVICVDAELQFIHCDNYPLHISMQWVCIHDQHNLKFPSSVLCKNSFILLKYSPTQQARAERPLRRCRAWAYCGIHQRNCHNILGDKTPMLVAVTVPLDRNTVAAWTLGKRGCAAMQLAFHVRIGYVPPSKTPTALDVAAVGGCPRPTSLSCPISGISPRHPLWTSVCAVAASIPTSVFGTLMCTHLPLFCIFGTVRWRRRSLQTVCTLANLIPVGASAVRG